MSIYLLVIKTTFCFDRAEKETFIFRDNVLLLSLFYNQKHTFSRFFCNHSDPYSLSTKKFSLSINSTGDETTVLVVSSPWQFQVAWGTQTASMEMNAIWKIQRSTEDSDSGLRIGLSSLAAQYWRGGLLEKKDKETKLKFCNWLKVFRKLVHNE